ncbi:hypothetical protein NERG_01152 [Nematocida ausubeli]|uniref:Uncharacterized protein n=1 Tax=Nematocida ausubeli (strain ATCC PRA-371 / ERTm2) TaxID=1913371 RepID=H8ZD05_NEMA1|nr:hypothetical protein NERG_01152 [Nematocida ausubeli]
MEDTKGARPTSVSYSKLNLEYIDADSMETIDEVISINDQVDIRDQAENNVIQARDAEKSFKYFVFGLVCSILVFLVFVIYKNNSSLNIPNVEDSLNGNLSMNSQLLV